ncbi:Crp/Fnr family transcriptional regulator [Fusobacterium sp. PH5-44]|uniref:Crp/Fnr family transcriptional regulator n=1 Tax=unclassified Fusobacterium TaxID=2648384 RepID=UPI003D19B1A9
MDTKILSKSDLFNGIKKEEIIPAINCLQGKIKFFKKENFIFQNGDRTKTAGILLEGAINIIQSDLWGNQNIISHIGEGEIFAEAYACTESEPLMVDVIAIEDCKILFIDTNKIINICQNSCIFHNILMKNILKILATKNLALTRKISVITPKLIRERLMRFFSYEATKKNSLSFEIPFSRQQLADYLSVERSALSHELSKMQKEKIIIYKKNSFTLIKENII